MPTIDIDGRGFTVQEAITDMWNRVHPLADKGYHPTTNIEIVDTSTNKVIESFPMSDAELKSRLTPTQSTKQVKTVPDKNEQHKTKQHGQYAFVARIRMEY